MTNDNGEFLVKLEERRQALEDIGLNPNPTGQFMTVLTEKLGVDLPLQIESAPAAKDFLHSYHMGHSEALQRVRAEDLLTAIHEDLHHSKIEMMPTYEKEKAWKQAGELDAEDLTMHERLGNRLNGLQASLMKLAEMRENKDNSFEYIKDAADKAREQTTLESVEITR